MIEKKTDINDYGQWAVQCNQINRYTLNDLKRDNKPIVNLLSTFHCAWDILPVDREGKTQKKCS